MKYNARQRSNGKFAVFRGNKRFWPSTETDDQAQAQASAAYMSADWHLEQARDLMTKTRLQDACLLAHEAESLIEAVVERQRKEDPNFDEMDPRAFLA